MFGYLHSQFGVKITHKTNVTRSCENIFYNNYEEKQKGNE